MRSSAPPPERGEDLGSGADALTESYQGHPMRTQAAATSTSSIRESAASKLVHAGCYLVKPPCQLSCDAGAFLQGWFHRVPQAGAGA